MNDPLNARLTNFATSVEWQPATGLYVYKLELTQAESSEISRLAHYGYDCEISEACHDITWPAEGVVAYHFHEHEAHEVLEAYAVKEFVECLV